MSTLDRFVSASLSHPPAAAVTTAMAAKDEGMKTGHRNLTVGLLAAQTVYALAQATGTA